MKPVMVVALTLLFHDSFQKPKLVESADIREIPADLDILGNINKVLTELQFKVRSLEDENAVLKVKLQKNIKQDKLIAISLEKVTKDVAAQAAEITVMRTAVAASEQEVKKWVKESKALKKGLNANEKALQSLKKEVIEKPRVAFSAGLSSSIGPLSTLSVLVFTKVFTNTGESYNPNTGVFTAPTAGLYYFRITACGSTNGHYSGVSLYRNQERLTQLFEFNDDGYTRHFSGGLAMELDKGDMVDVRLPTSHRLYEDSYNRNIFTGFLLFPTPS